MKKTFSKNKLFGIIIGIILIITVGVYLTNKNSLNIKTSKNNSYIDKKTQDFLFGEWKINKLIGFDRIQNDYSNYPNGQEVIGNIIVINKDVFSTIDIEKYPRYQIEITNPIYYLGILYDVNFIIPINSSEKEKRIKDIIESKSLQYISVKNSEISYAPVGLIISSSKSLILDLDSTFYELKKVQ